MMTTTDYDDGDVDGNWWMRVLVMMMYDDE